MLEAVVGVAVVLLIAAGVIVMFGPNIKAATRRLISIRPPAKVPAAFQSVRSRDVVPSALNPKTQRVIVAAARLASWLRAHAPEDVARRGRAPPAGIHNHE